MSSIRTLISLAGVPSLVLCSGPQVGENVPFIHYLSGDFMLEWTVCSGTIWSWLFLNSFILEMILFLIFWGPFKHPPELFANVFILEYGSTKTLASHKSTLFAVLSELMSIKEKADHLPALERLNKRCVRLGKSRWCSFLLLDLDYMLVGVGRKRAWHYFFGTVGKA